MSHQIFVLSITLSTLVFCNKLLADFRQQNNEPPTIVITGSNLPVDENQDTLTTVIIEKETIEQINPRNVSQLLSSIPGFYIENSSSRGGFNGLYLRGADPNFTAVLINGVNVNDPTNSRGGAFDFSLLDINSIERIEIVKGPVSSLYGSDALAGIVNIITRQASKEISADARVEVGANDLFNASAFAGSTFEEGNVSLNVSYSDDGEQIEGSGYKANSARLGGEYEIFSKTLFSVNFSFNDAEAQSFPDASGGPEYAVIRDVDKKDTQQQVHSLALRYDKASGEQIKLQFNYYQSEENNDSVGIDPVIPATVTDSDYQQQKLLFTYYKKLSANTNASMGAEMQWEEGESKGVIDPGGFDIPTNFELDRNMSALFGELEYLFNPNWRTYLGVRVDWPEELSSETSPRLGISYQRNNTTYSFDWGRGFKLPSFYALAHPIVGNPEFKPETSENYQLALLHKFSSDTEATITGFWSNYFDLIDFDNNSNMLVQRSEVEINGVEITMKHHFTSSLFMHFQYSWMQQDIVDSDEELLKRPDRTGGLTFSWRSSKSMQVSLGARYVGEIKDFSFPTGLRTLDSYTRVDASLNWTWSKHWRGNLAIDNLLDTDYEEAIGFWAPGIGARISITASI